MRAFNLKNEQKSKCSSLESKLRSSHRQERCATDCAMERSCYGTLLVLVVGIYKFLFKFWIIDPCSLDVCMTERNEKFCNIVKKFFVTL